MAFSPIVVFLYLFYYKQIGKRIKRKLESQKSAVKGKIRAK